MRGGGRGGRGVLASDLGEDEMKQAEVDGCGDIG